MNKELKEELITLLKAGFTREEILKIYNDDPAPAANDPAPAASDPAPAASVENASFNMDALNKAFDGFIDKINKTVEKFNIQNSQIGANPETSIPEMIGNVIMPDPTKQKGE